MCNPGYLDDYAAVGGKWQRSDPTYGRVGSIFSDPGTGLVTTINPVEDWSQSDGNLYSDDGLQDDVFATDSDPDVAYDYEGYEEGYGESYGDGSYGGEAYQGSISDTAQTPDGAIMLR
jgi:hypothetical protein